MPRQRSPMARRGRIGRSHRKNRRRVTIVLTDGSGVPPKLGYRVASAQGGFAMAPDTSSTLDRLGHEIAELSSHLGAATAHLLDLIPSSSTRAVAGTPAFSPA